MDTKNRHTSVAVEGFKIARQLLGATGFGPPVAEPQQAEAQGLRATYDTTN